MRDKFIIELMQQDGIIEAEAREAVKNTFWPFLARALGVHLPSDLNITESVSKVRTYYRTTRRRLEQNMHILKIIYRKMIPHQGKDFHLNALLSPHSKYHEDFKSVYKVITGFQAK